MPETEFELYLSLLGKFLRLNPAQRDEVADELRDHLEQRLEDLAAQGLARPQAIQRALEEFGDAAELAQHFTRVAQIRRRKLIMRCTYGTTALLAAGLLIAAAFWPEGSHAPLPNRVVAQQAGLNPSSGIAGANDVERAAADDKARVEAALNRRLAHLTFVEATLEDVIKEFEQKLEIDILIDRATLADEGVALDQPVSFSVERTQLTGRAALELILEPFQLGFTIRDGLLMVSTAVKLGEGLEVQVYNVRDLMVAHVGPVMQSAKTHRSSAAFASVESLVGPLAESAVGQFGGTGGSPPAVGGLSPIGAAGSGTTPGMTGPSGGGMAGGFGGGVLNAAKHETNSLAELIAITVDPDTWSDVGGAGSIVQYGDGLLVAKNTQKVHGKIRELLKMLRESQREQSSGPGVGGGYAPVVPGGAPVYYPSSE